MNTYDYMNVVKGYVINKIENKKNIENPSEIIITPVRESNSNGLNYIVEEYNNKHERLFYLKFTCENKREFYEAMNSLFVQYFASSNNLLYTSTKDNGNSFSLVSKNYIALTLNSEDNLDNLMFAKFKEYIDDIQQSKENTIESTKINQKILMIYPEKLDIAVS